MPRRLDDTAALLAYVSLYSSDNNPRGAVGGLSKCAKSHRTIAVRTPVLTRSEVAPAGQHQLQRRPVKPTDSLHRHNDRSPVTNYVPANDLPRKPARPACTLSDRLTKHNHISRRPRAAL